MDKTFYILPGWEDVCGLPAYQELANAARTKGYTVIFRDIDWKKPLSEQIFSVPPNATVFGFSLGAILAWLIAEKYPCKHLILASMTPHYSFTNAQIKQALTDLAGKEFVEDIIARLLPTHQAEKQTIIYGDREAEPADVLVPNTDHELTSEYIDIVKNII